MSKALATKNVAAVLLAVAMVFGFAFAFATPAKADTLSDLQAQVNALLAQIAALQGGSSASASTGASCHTFTQDLKQGSAGGEVMWVQQFLNSHGATVAVSGAGSAGNETSTFGPATKAAVMKFQTTYAADILTPAGLTVATGNWGPATRAKANALCAGNMGNGGSTGTGTGTGTALTGSGRLANVDGSGEVESDLKEGDKSTSVVAISGDVRDGDLMLQRVDAEFDLSGSSGSTNISKYASSVDLYVDGNKVASMDPSDGDKNGSVWTFRFTNFGSNAVLKEGTSPVISVHVTPLSSIGTNEDGENVKATIPQDGIRVVDAHGISDTYVSANENQTFTVSSATDGQVTVSESDSNPDDTTVKVDTDTTTDDVTLMAADLRAKKQDVTVHDFPVQICASTSTNSKLSDVVQSVQLMRGSSSLKSESVPTTAGLCQTIVFDNIDKDISQDSTDSYSVTATIKKQDSTTYANAATLTASTTAALAWDVEDSNGNNVNPTGGAQGGTMTLQTTGISVALNGTPDSPVVTAHQGAADTFTATISFKVTAGDDDLWIAKSVASSSTAVGAKTTWDLADGSTGGVASTSGALDASGSTTNDSASGYKVSAGSTRTFTLTVTGTGNVTGLVGVKLVGVGYDTDSTVTGSTTTYTTGLSDFKTPKVTVSS